MSKVLVDRGLLERVLEYIPSQGVDPISGVDRVEPEEVKIRAILAQPAEAEGVVELGSDAWMALHLLDRLDVSADKEPRVQQVEDIVRRMRAALSAVTAERDGLLADRDDCLEARQYYADKCREVTAERDRIRAYVEAMRVDALPDGFVAVPTEPTEEMLTAYSTNPSSRRVCMCDLPRHDLRTPGCLRRPGCEGGVNGSADGFHSCAPHQMA